MTVLVYIVKSRLKAGTLLLGMNTVPTGPLQTVVTFTRTSTDGGSPTVQVRLMFVGGLFPISTIGACVEVTWMDDSWGTIENDYKIIY